MLLLLSYIATLITVASSFCVMSVCTLYGTSRLMTVMVILYLL